MYLILRWLLSALAILGAAYLINGFEVSSFYTALIVALIMGFLNALVRPILLLLTFPLTVLTLGFFIFVINGILLWFASTFIRGFEIHGFISAFLGAVLISFFSWIGNRFLDKAFD